MRRLLSKSVVLAAGLLSAHNATHSDLQVLESKLVSGPPDVRLLRLREFFSQFGCPARTMAQEFLHASDRHNLDWRLLPSIAFVETGAGKHAPNHNLFGWNSQEGRFASWRASIHHVAARLSNSKTYANKSLRGVLTTYNHSRQDYPDLVMKVMRRVDSSEPPRLRARYHHWAYCMKCTP